MRIFPFAKQVVDGLLSIGGEVNLIFDVRPTQVFLDQACVAWIIFY
jgi:hypothetical protein